MSTYHNQYILHQQFKDLLNKLIFKLAKSLETNNKVTWLNQSTKVCIAHHP